MQHTPKIFSKVCIFIWLAIALFKKVLVFSAKLYLLFTESRNCMLIQHVYFYKWLYNEHHFTIDSFIRIHPEIRFNH